MSIFFIFRCTINTNKWYHLAHFQNENTATITMEQDGKEYTFDICNDGGYVSNMATSYGGMVYSGSLWGLNSMVTFENHDLAMPRWWRNRYGMVGRDDKLPWSM